ncbi:MAG: ATP-binding protein [Sandaracinaceae bacterium]
MSDTLKDLADCEKQLRSALAQLPRPPTHAVVSCAYWSRGGDRTVGTGRVVLLGAEAPAPTTRSYPGLRLTTEVLRDDDLVSAILSRVRGDTETIRWANWERYIDDRAGAWPFWELRLSTDSETVQPTNDPVIAFGQPPKLDTRAAVSEWIGDDRWSPAQWRIVLPDERARFGGARFSEEGLLEISLESTFPSSEVEVQVVYGTSLRRETSCEATTLEEGDTVTFRAPSDAEQATLYLVSRSDEVLDRAHVRRDPHEPTAAEQLEIVDRCKVDLAAGEREEVELKPWISPKNAKEREVVETIVALANTGGGHLYVGVRSSGSPEGRSALFKAFRAESGAKWESVEATVRAWLRDLVQEKLRRPPPVEEHLIEVHGEPVLCVVVGQGAELPYATIENDIFIRRGANNRRPDPYSELPQLVGSAFQLVDSSVVWSG